MSSKTWVILLALLASVVACGVDEPADGANNGGTNNGGTNNANNTGANNPNNTGTNNANNTGTNNPNNTGTNNANNPNNNGGEALLVINEVSLPADPGDWFELYNAGAVAVDLAGWTFTDDLEERQNLAAFPDGASVEPGAYLLVQFDDVYPGFGLKEDEELGLVDPEGNLVDSVDWEDGDIPDLSSFGRVPNGTGSFKTLFNPSPGLPNQDNAGGAVCGNNQTEGDETCDDGNREDHDGCSAACTEEVCGNDIREGDEECDGSPDCDLECKLPRVEYDIQINEVVPNPASGPDWIEIYNGGIDFVDLNGWTLGDEDSPAEERFAFPEGTVLEGFGYLLILGSGEDGFDFGLSGTDQARLYDGDGILVSLASWHGGNAVTGTSWGRLPDGEGDFQTLFAPTPGRPNQANEDATCGDERAQVGEVCDGADLIGRGCDDLGFVDGGLSCSARCDSLNTSACNPREAGVLLNEISSDAGDRIELINTSAASVDISGWTVSDGSARPDHTYAIPAGTQLAPGERAFLTRDLQHLFGLGQLGEVVLSDDSGVVRDRAAYLYGEAEVSFCRLPDGAGAFQPCAAATFGEPNQ